MTPPLVFFPFSKPELSKTIHFSANHLFKIAKITICVYSNTLCLFKYTKHREKVKNELNVREKRTKKIKDK